MQRKISAKQQSIERRDTQAKQCIAWHHKEGRDTRGKGCRERRVAWASPNRLLTLGLGFVFNDPGKCNLNMVKFFFANWKLKERALCKIGLRFEEPLDDADTTDEKQARVNFDLESNDEEDDFEMGEAALASTVDED
ncbi:hypothetical protein HAX54_010238 [Datura stramonium]|uniref:Uncharacterized protein n=1 Tax=Datura stramonium TaxID=4076 RepID=A0ABS8RWY4_DATST|nr:hypothetical protein [Datura stramonium]